MFHDMALEKRPHPPDLSGRVHLAQQGNQLVEIGNVLGDSFVGPQSFSYGFKRIGDVRVTGRAVVEVTQRPRPAGERGWPPVEIEMARSVYAFPLALRQEAKEVLASVCTGGSANGYPVVDVKVRLREITLNDATEQLVPLRASVTLALRHAFVAAGMTLLEPVMSLELRVPEGSLGAVMRDLGSRRAEIHETIILGSVSIVRAFVPLVGMFGYSTDLRSLTQGQGSFSMEPFDFLPVPEAVSS
jgi:translation elongation factor EF-G